MSEIKTVDDLIFGLLAARKEELECSSYETSIMSGFLAGMDVAIDYAEQLKANMEKSFNQFLWDNHAEHDKYGYDFIPFERGSRRVFNEIIMGKGYDTDKND